MKQNDFKLLEFDNHSNKNSEKLEKKVIKQTNKNKAENALDNVVRLWKNAKLNGLTEFEISEDYLSPIRRYYRNYWLKELIKIKADYNCHIILVLHENGSDMGNGKAKGHLGSLLENTCETIIRVEKDKNNRSRSIVSPKEMRGEEFDSFVIEMDFQGIPYISILEEHEQGKLKI
jgi:hypothetical protein